MIDITLDSGGHFGLGFSLEAVPSSWDFCKQHFRFGVVHHRSSRFGTRVDLRILVQLHVLKATYFVNQFTAIDIGDGSGSNQCLNLY
jgi:hypothetical protein